MQLYYFTDPMCSWCWGFEPVVRKLSEVTDSPLRIFVGGLYAGNVAPLSAERLAKMPQLWAQVADATGQEFCAPSLPEGFAYNTEPSCRALVTAREIEAEDAADFLAVLHRAFYVQGQDITDEQVLLQLYAEFRPQRADEFANLFPARVMRECTREDIEYTREQLGIAAFPTLVLQSGMRMRRISQGYNSLEDLLPVFNAAQQKLATAG